MIIIIKENILEPEVPSNGNPNFGVPIPPIDRLKIMSDSDFEDLVTEWAYGYLKKDYASVYRLGGSGDKGRDICAEFPNGQCDIYQCKHYDRPLTPSEYVVEFGKLVYYTSIENGYPIPNNYYIVASKGLGTSLVDIVKKPDSIKNLLISNWDTKCRNQITKTEEIKLTGEFLEYVENFDYSIIHYLSPSDLLEQYRKTPFFKFRFGGGIKRRPRAEIPEISPDESEMPYVKELISVYTSVSERDFDDFNSFIQEESEYTEHFKRQRKAYFTADSLKRFLRDEYISGGVFDTFRTEIYDAVIDLFSDDYPNKYDRLKKILKAARELSIRINEIPDILPNDKVGTCHMLVEKGVIHWDD